MYKKFAQYYDLIYSFKDYKYEVEKVKEIIAKYKHSEGIDLLDVACGTGKHLKYLRESFNCMGIDINEEMLSIAKKNVDGVKFKVADMITFNLYKRFDIILCLFSSIGYVKTYSNLNKTINNFFNHLKKGGILIIEPWFTKSTFIAGKPGMATYEEENLKIARLNTSIVKENVSIMDMHYLIAEKNKELQYFIDRHELGLFDIDKFLKIMEDASFQAKFLEDGLMEGRGLYIGIKS